ncbi:MAG: hypothetical protein J6Y62_02060 [Clostridia bacterium]|nr:hypothetical protein [Clostridia bacterium]
MKITLVTVSAYKERPEYLDSTERLKFSYCLKWKWGYKCRKALTRPGYHPVWEKMPVLKEALKEGADWAVWMDADAAPVTPSMDVGSYLAAEEKKIIMLKDRNGINAGVFAVPNERHFLEWLDYIDKQRDNPRYRDGWKEQNAMKDSFAGPFKGCMKEPPREIGWNQYLDVYDYRNEWNLWREGDWCLHLPACRDSFRTETFKKHMEVI